MFLAPLADCHSSNNNDSSSSTMDDTVAGLGKGSRVWYRHTEKDKAGQERTAWLLGEIRDASSGDGSSVSITLLGADEGVPGLLAGKAVEELQDGQGGVLVPANPALQRAIADLTQLSYLNEPSILDNLTQRYRVDNIYTNAGPVLIAVNPCRNLPLYTDQVQHDYKGGCRGWCCRWWVGGWAYSSRGLGGGSNSRCGRFPGRAVGMLGSGRWD